MSKESLILTEPLCKAVEAEIARAELLTSGEIMVHVEHNCAEDPYKHAVKVFESLGMQNTELRNGVLIYLSLEDHKIVILGDAGIHQFVRPEGWDDLVHKLSEHFKRGQFQQGLCEVIHEIANRLEKHFPRMTNDRNELSNQISFSK